MGRTHSEYDSMTEIELSRAIKLKYIVDVFNNWWKMYLHAYACITFQLKCTYICTFTVSWITLQVPYKKTFWVICFVIHFLTIVLSCIYFTYPDHVLKSTSHNGFPVIVSRESQYLVGFVLRRDLNLALCECYYKNYLDMPYCNSSQ